jgi:secretion/DNA translocation related TadE-like protein
MMSERGSVSLLLTGTVLVVGGAIIAAVMTTGAVLRGRAEAVADVVALAAAGALLQQSGPCEVAATVAKKNSAHLVRCQPQGAVVEVQVTLATPAAIARLSGWDRIEMRSAAELLPAVPSGQS